MKLNLDNLPQEQELESLVNGLDKTECIELMNQWRVKLSQSDDFQPTKAQAIAMILVTRRSRAIRETTKSRTAKTPKVAKPAPTLEMFRKKGA